MASSNLFAPPTKEELSGSGGPDIFAPPTKEELTEKNNSFDPNAAIQGLGNGAAMGYLPQLQAAAGGLVPDPNRALDEKLKGQGFKINQPEDTYVSRRDAAAQNLASLAKESPVSYYGGMLGGAIAASPAIGAGLAEIGIGPAAADAGLLSKSLQAAKGGAAVAAAQNPGETPGQVSPVQIDERLQNAKTGAIFGAGFQAAASGIQGAVRFVKGIPDFINDFAEVRAAKTAGATKTDFKSSVKFDRPGETGETLRKLGRYAIDNKIVRPGDAVQDVADRASELKSTIGKRLGEVYDRAASLASDPEVISKLPPEEQRILLQSEFNPREMAKEFVEKIQSQYQGSPQGKEVLRRAARIAQNLSENGASTDINAIHDFRSGLDDMIYRADTAFKRTGTTNAGDEALSEMRDFITQKIERRINALDKVFKGSLGDDLKAANKSYSNVSKLNSMAQNGVATQLGNQMFSPSDKGAGMLGAGIGAVEGYHNGGIVGGLKGAAIGGAAGLANKAARTYLPALAASGANAVGGKLNQIANSPLGQAAGNYVAPALIQGAGLMANPAVVGAGVGAMKYPDYSTIPGKNIR